MLRTVLFDHTVTGLGLLKVEATITPATRERRGDAPEPAWPAEVEIGDVVIVGASDEYGQPYAIDPAEFAVPMGRQRPPRYVPLLDLLEEAALEAAAEARV